MPFLTGKAPEQGGSLCCCAASESIRISLWEDQSPGLGCRLPVFRGANEIDLASKYDDFYRKPLKITQRFLINGDGAIDLKPVKIHMASWYPAEMSAWTKEFFLVGIELRA